jgi:ribosomal protein S17
MSDSKKLVRTLIGKVVSDKRAKTVTVLVDRKSVV